MSQPRRVDAERVEMDAAPRLRVNSGAEPTPIADAISSAFPSFATMTDEQWAERDARVGAELAAVRSRPEHTIGALVERGFPRRAAEQAAIADETRSAICRLSRWLDAPDGVLVIGGTKGCGKTVAGAWWALRIARPARFVRAASFAASSRYDRDERALLLKAPALVLDDLGAEYLDASGSFLVDLDELIDVFYGDRKPLLITTNCTRDEFKARYGERVADRMRECGSYFAIADGSLRSAARQPTTRRHDL